jgi:L,D-transpeptidase YcbB
MSKRCSGDLSCSITKMNFNQIICKKIIVSLLLVLFIDTSQAQDEVNKLGELLSSTSLSAYGLKFVKETKAFYKLNGYHISWLGRQQKTNLEVLSGCIKKSASLGLDERDYQPALFVKDYSRPVAESDDQDLLKDEIKITDAAIHFFHDVMMGNHTEPLSYNGLSYTPECNELSALLFYYLSSDKLSLLPDDIEPKDKGYISLKEQLAVFLKTTSVPGFKDVSVGSGKVQGNSQSLVKRLCQLGFIKSDTVVLSDAELKNKLKEAQQLFCLLADGTLRSTTLAAINITLQTRVDELKNALNCFRWLNCIKDSSTIIVVNIPSASLLLYEQGRIGLSSRIIVGKGSTPTPTLCSKITEVILYPYWHVPFKIATRELLPRIKRNRGYLDANNYQVLNMQGKIMNPYKINWRNLSRNYFPYVIRQSTGCDNALGLIKLNFYNPFSVYLHDTPGKNLFSLNKRYFSHGCMRLERAMELGHYLLGNNAIAIDTLTQKGCLKNQSPVIVPAMEKIPVFVLYHTAWVDEAGHVGFYEDVYDKVSAMKLD